MFYGAKPKLFVKARILRENLTKPEKLLWGFLKENQLGVRFKSQHPIDIYIADFYCHELKLVIEVDGENHKQNLAYDESRTAALNHYGIKVIRFSNEEIINEIENVIAKIKREIILLS